VHPAKGAADDETTILETIASFFAPAARISPAANDRTTHPETNPTLNLPLIGVLLFCQGILW
jgi:hypothetical protein